MGSSTPTMSVPSTPRASFNNPAYPQPGKMVSKKASTPKLGAENKAGHRHVSFDFEQHKQQQHQHRMKHHARPRSMMPGDMTGYAYTSPAPGKSPQMHSSAMKGRPLSRQSMYSMGNSDPTKPQQRHRHHRHHHRGSTQPVPQLQEQKPQPQAQKLQHRQAQQVQYPTEAPPRTTISPVASSNYSKRSSSPEYGHSDAPPELSSSTSSAASSDNEVEFKRYSDDSFFGEEAMTEKSDSPPPLPDEQAIKAQQQKQKSSPPPNPQQQQHQAPPRHSMIVPSAPTGRSTSAAAVSHLSMTGGGPPPGSTAPPPRSVSATNDINNLAKASDGRLKRPVVVPQAASGDGLPFNRAYAPLLNHYGISEDCFLGVIDGLNKNCKDKNHLIKYINQANEQTFGPKGLQVSVLNSQNLANRLNLFDWHELACPLTSDQMGLSVTERKIAGFKNKVAELEFHEDEFKDKKTSVENQTKDLLAERRKTMIHQDWFNPLEAYKQQEIRNDVKIESKVRRLSEIQIRADKKRDKAMAKLEKSKQKQIEKMRKSLQRDQEHLDQENRRATEELSKEMKTELDSVDKDIKELEDLMRARNISLKYLEKDPSMKVLQKRRTEIIDKFHGLMEHEMHLYESESRRRRREYKVEKSDYTKVCDEKAEAFQNQWDKDMGRTSSNKRDKEIEMLRITQWILVDVKNPRRM